jgi:hypothetical protein
VVLLQRIINALVESARSVKKVKVRGKSKMEVAA